MKRRTVLRTGRGCIHLASALWGMLVLAPLSSAQEEGPPVAAPASAPEATAALELSVAAKGTGRPLKRAEVTIGSDVFTSDPNGMVKLTIPPREGSLQVSRQGYETVFVSFDELRNKASYKVYLPPGKPDDSEVVIIGSRRTEVSRKTITVRETNRIAPGGDAAQVTQLLPGVQSNPGRTEVVIRGSGPNDSRYFVDDIVVGSLFHDIANLSIIPNQQLASVEFNSGGFGVQYGDATGGVIVLRSSDQIPEAPRSEFVVNVPFYLGLFHERPLSENSSVAVSFRRSTIEAILPQVLPKELDATVVPFFYDFYARYLHKSEATTYKLTAIASTDGLSLVVPFDAAERSDGRANIEFKNSFQVLALERDHNLGGGWRYRSTPQVRNSRFKATFISNDLYLNGKSLLIPTEFSKRLDRGRFVYLGFTPEWNQTRVDAEVPAPISDDPYFDPEDAPKLKAARTYNISQYAAWAAMDFGGDNWTVTPGLRGFASDLIKEYGIDPRLQLRYLIDKENTLKAAYGQYSIAPEPPEASAEFGNPDLGYEKSIHSVLGIESRWGDRWETEFQTFYKKTYRLIVSGGAQTYQDTGTRRTYGFEAFIRRNLTERWLGWLSYTYSVSQERKSDESPWFTSSYDQTHILNLAGSYRLSAFWDLGSRFKYNTGNPYTPVTGSVYNGNLDKYQPLYNQNEPYSGRLPGFHSLDLFATYDSLYNEFKLKYQFGVQYLALGKRINSIEYNYDYSEKEAVANLPPIPYFQLSGEF